MKISFDTPQKAETVIFKTSYVRSHNWCSLISTCYSKFGARVNGWLSYPDFSRVSAIMVTIGMCQSSLSQSAFPLRRYGREGDYSCREPLSYVYDMKTYGGDLLVAHLPNLELHPELTYSVDV